MATTLTMRNNDRLSTLEKVSLVWGVFLALISLMPWFLWQVPFGQMVWTIPFLVLGVPMMRIRNLGRNGLGFLIVFLLFDLWYAQFTVIPLLDSIYRFINMLPIVCVAFYSLRYKKALLKWIIQTFSVIVGVSLVAFILCQMGFSLPYSYLKHENTFYGTFTNYYLFINAYELKLLTRFQSVFTEPGHVGMMCALFMYITGYSWRKWQNIVMTIAMIWTFSLAGYVLYIAGVLLRLLSVKGKLHKLVLTLAMVGVGITATIYVVNSIDEDIMENMVFRRLEFSKTKGFEGNNRNDQTFERRYNNLMENGDLITGIGRDKYVDGNYAYNNSSYKNFIVENGFIGLILLWLAMSLYYRSNPSRRGFNFMLLMALSFLQRPYLTWTVQSFTLICALSFYCKYPTEDLQLSRIITRKKRRTKRKI